MFKRCTFVRKAVSSSLNFFWTLTIFQKPISPVCQVKKFKKKFKELETAFLTKLDLLSVLRKVSSEYFNTFYESRRTFELLVNKTSVKVCSGG